MTRQKRKLRWLWLALIALLILGAVFIPRNGIPASLWVWAKSHGVSPNEYPQALIALYKRNEDARTFVCDYPLKRNQETEIDLSGEYTPGTAPLLMQWDERWGYRSYNENLMGLSGCGPTCMAMAAIYLTGDTGMNPWAMAQYAEQHGYNVVGSGTRWSFFTDGAAGLGLNSTAIPVDQQRIFDNLAVGNPIVCVVGPGDFTTEGHFILLCGEEDGKIRVNDPNSQKNSAKLWDYDTLARQIQGLWVLRA